MNSIVCRHPVVTGKQTQKCGTAEHHLLPQVSITPPFPLYIWHHSDVKLSWKVIHHHISDHRH